MDVGIKTLNGVTVAEIVGDIDGSTAPIAQQRVMEQVSEGSRIILDLSGVPYMSSAGLRMLLATYRHVSAQRGQIVLAGVREEIQDTMSVTGFLKFFTVVDTVDAALGALTA